MAIKNNQGTKTQQVVAKVYATDEAGMRLDAKEYAKRDFTVVTATIEALGLTIDHAKIAEALIEVKYNQIVEARTNRVSYFD